MRGEGSQRSMIPRIFAHVVQSLWHRRRSARSHKLQAPIMVTVPSIATRRAASAAVSQSKLNALSP